MVFILEYQILLFFVWLCYQLLCECILWRLQKYHQCNDGITLEDENNSKLRQHKDGLTVKFNQAISLHSEMFRYFFTFLQTEINTDICIYFWYSQNYGKYWQFNECHFIHSFVMLYCVPCTCSFYSGSIGCDKYFTNIYGANFAIYFGDLFRLLLLLRKYSWKFDWNRWRCIWFIVV